jgi:hypothetical protein
MNQADFPVTQMCRVLGLSPSGYYAWLKRAPSARSQANTELVERMRQIHRLKVLSSQRVENSPHFPSSNVSTERGQLQAHISQVKPRLGFHTRAGLVFAPSTALAVGSAVGSHCGRPSICKGFGPA